ncbi:RNA polymerase sigma-70 factor [Actinopolymorpha sp. B11F2]|uniref:RNA polymerase sigma-70 factor n=1 Tax=Actinopolymorpha sp. B11F2 TaxID=3160862 RepID=UPI0032E36B72
MDTAAAADAAQPDDDHGDHGDRDDRDRSAADVAVFAQQRSRVFGLAYRLLGSAADAEDMVQETFLRWLAADPGTVSVPEAWLTRVVTNLCLNRLTSARVQRERYVGPWLPEPVLTEGGALGPMDTVEQRESVSFGVLLLLERLTPPERAVFVLRAAFGYSHQEIAAVLDIGEAHARQLYHRARGHVGDHRRRFAADADEQRRLVERFFAAAVDGDIAGLERLLAEDVVSWADGGGQVTAARRPVSGRDRVVRYLLGVGRRPEAAGARVEFREVNATASVVIRLDGSPAAVLVPEIRDGRVAAVRIVVSPAKLAFVSAQLA